MKDNAYSYCFVCVRYMVLISSATEMITMHGMSTQFVRINPKQSSKIYLYQSY